MLISMAVWDTEENQRTELTRATLESLADTVDWARHRLFISDNGSCEATQRLYKEIVRFGLPKLRLIENGENIGTARAVNRGWSYRRKGEHVLKMDNDVVIHDIGWADDMEEVFRRDPSIGICGLKRKDILESPDSPNPQYKSTLSMLPHAPGERWMVLESVNHVIGTCQAYSSSLFDKIGYLYQGNWKYGFDDALASLRAHISGFKTVFIPHVEIDHIDPGTNSYQKEKEQQAGEVIGLYSQLATEFLTGRRPVYYDGGEDATWATSHPE